MRNTFNIATDGARPSFANFVRVSVPVFAVIASSILDEQARPQIDAVVDAHLGYCKMFIFVAPVASLVGAVDFRATEELSLCAALSVAPWFRVRDKLPPMDLGVAHNANDWTQDVRRLSMSYPILPALHAPPPPDAEWLSDKDFSSVYAFALTWHAHSQRVARHDRRVPREILLTRVSERFFSRGAAGPALFSTPMGSHKMARAVARLRTPRAHRFLIAALVDALGVWCELCEKRCYRELSMIDLVRGSLAPACEALTNVANFVCLPADLCNSFPCIYGQADIRLLTAQECVDQKRLTRDEALYLVFQAGAIPEDAEDEDLDEATVGAALSCTVLLSHQFCTGLDFIDKALIGKEHNTLMKTNSLMRNGVRYLPALGNAREMLKRLFRYILKAHAGNAKKEDTEADEDGVAVEDDDGAGNVREDDDVDDFEARLLAALPDVDDATSFADERCTDFDDRWPSAVQARGPIERYDIAADLGLQRSTRILARRKRVGGEPLSLAASLSVLHTAQCHEPVARGGHIQIDYSSGRERSGEQLRGALLVHGRELDPGELLRLLKMQASAKSSMSPTTASTSQTSAQQPPPRSSSSSMQIDAPTSMPGCMHHDALHATKVGDIEDLVSNAHTNHALPLCMEKFVQKLMFKKEHLPNNERKLYYRLLRSTALPELTHERTLRHMLIATENEAKLADQWGDMDKGFEKMLDSSHAKAAEGYQRAMRENGRECSDEEALARTTCAPGCGTMQRTRYNGVVGCPFAWSDRAAVRRLLITAGIDQVRAQAISERSPSAASEACRLHAMAAHTDNITSPAPEALRKYGSYGFKHPYEFVHCSAKIILQKRENQ